MKEKLLINYNFSNKVINKDVVMLIPKEAW